MQSIGNLGVLGDERENRKMLAKLPEWVIAKWAGVVDQHRQDKGEFPPFKDFMEFVSKQARRATDPVTSFQSIRLEQMGMAKDRSEVNKWKQPHHTFVTMGEGQGKDTLIWNNRCILCQGSHELDTCTRFKDKNLAERRQFVMEMRLCFGCLHYGHVSRKCRQRKECKVCSRLHPTSFPGDIRPQKWTNTEEEENPVGLDGISGTTLRNYSESSKKKTSMILPVYISQADNPTAERLVYAILDAQSDTTFILQNTCKSLGIVGKPVKLKLSTMHAENKVIDSSKVQGLMVRGYNSQHRIMLPGTYTRNIMPANRTHIPTPEVAKSWPHLERIANLIPPLQGCEVGLLIGYNCVKALTPNDIIVPTGNGPYGQRTDLGWGIVGHVNGTWQDADGDNVGISHRIVAKDVASELAVHNGAEHHRVMFSLRNKIKEIIDQNSILNMFELDFSENCRKSESLSRDDMKFIHIMEKGIRLENGHYEMPLPFRDDMPSLPKNKEVALRHLQCLRKRFHKDKRYCNKYTAFMRDLVDNKFAEKVAAEDIIVRNGYEWYLPHHGVYHPRKPQKLRVVFDGSAQ